MTASSYRRAGLAAIASGIIGLMAFGILMYALVAHWDIAPGDDDIRFRAHDAGVILQFRLMSPVVFKLHELSHKHSQEISQSILILGVGALSFTVLLLVLNFAKVIADVLYMVTQGIFGVWLIIVNKRTSGILTKGLRRLGIVAGLGLLIVGTYPILFATLVDTILLHGPIPTNYVDPDTTTNIIIHVILFFGTLMGVTTYPIWSILFGRRLLTEENKHVKIEGFKSL